MSTSIKKCLTRPKYPLLFEGGSRSFFSALVSLGNQVGSRPLDVDQIGEIQIYPHAGAWHYRVFTNPYYTKNK